ncbi:MAG: hypothetical protein R3E01_36190 [Pirellulaceae bacterium]|nr:hypothetical protein [Planctomycetales bacterium]
MSVLLDTGPLVAVISRDDAYHDACSAAFASLTRSPATTWPVLTEAAWLLRHNLEHIETLFDYASESVIDVVDIDAARFALWLHTFLDKYADQKPQLADATLMYLADEFDVSTVFTTDRRDFSVFRRADGQPLAIIP